MGSAPHSERRAWDGLTSAWARAAQSAVPGGRRQRQASGHPRCVPSQWERRSPSARGPDPLSSAAPSGPSCSPNCSCLPILLRYPRVLKCRFYYHSGAVSASGQVTADTQTVARLLPGGGATPSHTATATAPRGSTRLVRRLREKMWASAFVVASQEGAGQARQAGLGMASLDNFRRLWSTGLSLLVWHWPWGG